MLIVRIEWMLLTRVHCVCSRSLSVPESSENDESLSTLGDWVDLKKLLRPSYLSMGEQLINVITVNLISVTATGIQLATTRILYRISVGSSGTSLAASYLVFNRIPNYY